MPKRVWPWECPTKETAVQPETPKSLQSNGNVSPALSSNVKHTTPATSFRPPLKNEHEDVPSSSSKSLTAPPAIGYIKEGMDADDGWMMVEDELELTAKLFTRHLHQQEYLSHKKRVAARGRDILSSIQRPVDMRTVQTNELKLKTKANEHDQALAKRLKRTHEADTSEEEFEAENSIDKLLSHQPEQRGVIEAVIQSSKPGQLTKTNVSTSILPVDDEDSSDDLDHGARSSTQVITAIPGSTSQATIEPQVTYAGSNTAPPAPAQPDHKSQSTTTSTAADLTGVAARLAKRKAALESKRTNGQLR